MLTWDDESPFVTMHELIRRKTPVVHMAAEIKARGLFERHGTKGVRYIERIEQKTFDALVALAAAVVDPMADSETPEVTYLGKDNPLYRMGWPEASLPNFEKINNANIANCSGWVNAMVPLFRSDLVTVGRLLASGAATVADIANEAEARGLYMLDAFGRIKPVSLSPGRGFSTTGYGPLGDLARVLADYHHLLERGVVPDESCYEHAVMHKMGWLVNQVPDFAGAAMLPVVAPQRPVPPLGAIPGSSTPPPTTQAPATAGPASEAAAEPPSSPIVIAGLYSLLRGDITPQAHPIWKGNQQEIIELIRDKFPPARGLSERNLKKVFADANRMRTTLGLPALSPEGEPLA